MKKLFKGLCKFFTFIIMSMGFVNFVVDKKNTKPNELSFMHIDVFNWSLGDIKYGVLGQGKPILLLHGLYPGAGMMEWEQNIISLSREYRVYAIDLLGFGQSDKPRIAYSPYLFVSLINDFIGKIIGEGCYVCATGGTIPFGIIANKMIAESGNPPIEKFLFINLGELDTPLLSIKEKLIKEIIHLPFIGTFIYNVYSIFFIKSGENKSLTKKMFNNAHYNGTSNRFPIASLLSSYLSMDLTEYMENVSIPTMLLWGEEGQIPNTEKIKLLCDANPHINISIFNKCRNFPHYENPTAFSTLVTGFFR